MNNLLVAVFIAIQIIYAFGNNCSNSETWNECGSPCVPERSCQNRNPPVPDICITSCVPRCECSASRGYIRDETSGECVKVCPDGCGALEVFEKCTSACVPEQTCQYQFPISPQICQLICIPKCVCDSSRGLIRNIKNGRCVGVEQCSRYCGPNQYNGCQPCCGQATCDNPVPVCRRICPFICINTCLCKLGYVRNADGKCILLKNCPKQ